MEVKDRGLTIRNAGARDAEILCRWWNDGRIMAHAGFPRGLRTNEEDIRESLSSDRDDTRRRLMLEVDSRPAGEMSYRILKDRSAEIGIKICETDYQEKGYGTRFLRMLIGELFTRGYGKIALDTNLDNIRAQHVYEKIGFIKKGVRKDCWKNQLGEFQSAVDYELSRSVEIVRLTMKTREHYARVDNGRTVSSRAILSFDEKGRLTYQIEEIPEPYEKGNESIEEDLHAYLNRDDASCYLALINDKVAGQIMIKKYWNNLASIEDIRVSQVFRRSGVGKALMEKALEWTKEKKLKGIRLETQDTNTGACRFYQSCGFTLEGCDRSLYTGFGNDETALYWYRSILFASDVKYTVQIRE